MALVDILSDSGTLSVILEFIALVTVVLGFFRWYDAKYKLLVRDTKNEITEKISFETERICDQIGDLKQGQNRLEESHYDHLQRHGEIWISDRRKDRARDEFDSEIEREEHEDERQRQEDTRMIQEEDRKESEIVRVKHEGNRKESEIKREERRKRDDERDRRTEQKKKGSHDQQGGGGSEQ